MAKADSNKALKTVKLRELPQSSQFQIWMNEKWLSSEEGSRTLHNQKSELCNNKEAFTEMDLGWAGRMKISFAAYKKISTRWSFWFPKLKPIIHRLFSTLGSASIKIYRLKAPFLKRSLWFLSCSDPLWIYCGKKRTKHACQERTPHIQRKSQHFLCSFPLLSPECFLLNQIFARIISVFSPFVLPFFNLFLW